MLLPLLLAFADPAGAVDVEKALKQFIDIFSVIQHSAADPVNSEQALYQGSIPGMLRRLDPHSVFFDPQQFEQLKEMEKSESKGFGTILSIVPGRVVVLQAMPGSPSAKSGLSPGDELLAVNNIALGRLEFDQVVQYLSEARQHQAALVVRRPGNVRLFNFVLDPAVLDAPSVDRAFFVAKGVGYIRVGSFDTQTAKQFKAALEKLDASKLNGLVIDFRSNPGGVVQTALECAALFLAPDQRVVSVKGRNLKTEDVDVPKGGTPYSFPLAILVGSKTASAAEIFTGAMQDHDRATVIGEPTYGKGLVQNVFSLSSNTALALTTAFYYTPSGRSIQRPLASGQLIFEPTHKEYKTDKGRIVLGGGGIQPDVVVHSETPTRLKIAIEGSGSFTAFATEYIQKNKVDSSFHATPSVVDDFHVFVSQRGIQPPVGEWLQESDYIQSRLEQEILNQALGVEFGDEVEARRDEMVSAALKSFGLPSARR
jgi:carboxyl-terminal processing protease